ncbi:hypothetical protein HDU99_000748 [Rhizoclosmatium hyalinum]|nr:hypothetical protein HDU99_000748 [Rhizoclosmatium hyalinum]
MTQTTEAPIEAPVETPVETLKRKAAAEAAESEPVVSECDESKRAKLDVDIDEGVAQAAQAAELQQQQQSSNEVEEEKDDGERWLATLTKTGTILKLTNHHLKQPNSIYPDSEDFYAWLVTGSEAGAFLACHRAKSCDPAIPACEKLVAAGVTQVYDPEDDDDFEDVNEDDAKQTEPVEASAAEAKQETEKEMTEEEKKQKEEMDDLKETVNFAIEDSYAIVLEDFVASEANPTESAAVSALRSTISACAESKSWIKLRVSREADAAATGIPVTVSVFDVRKGLVVPKIGCWKWLVEAEVADKSIDAGMKGMMEKFC